MVPSVVAASILESGVPLLIGDGLLASARGETCGTTAAVLEGVMPTEPLRR